MKKILAALAFLLLAGCNNPIVSNPFSKTPVWKLESRDSDISNILQVNGNQTSFTWPAAPTSVGYLTKAVNGLQVGVSMNFTVSAADSVVFDYRTEADNKCGTGSPGTIRLYFQRKGDNWTGQGEFQHYRYWAVSNGSWTKLEDGTYTITAMLDPAQWTDVYGKKGSDFPDAFQAAVKNAERFGVTFGGGCFFGHGVFVTGGTAKFTILGTQPM